MKRHTLNCENCSQSFKSIFWREDMELNLCDTCYKALLVEYKKTFQYTAAELRLAVRAFLLEVCHALWIDRLVSKLNSWLN